MSANQNDKEIEKLKLSYGSKYPTKYLLAWASYLKTQAKKDKKELDRFDDVKNFLSSVDSWMKKISSLEGEKKVQKKQSPIHTKEISQVEDSAREWRKTALDAVLIAYPYNPEIHSQFGKGAKLSSSIENLITEIKRISALLAKPDHKKVLSLINEKDFLKTGEGFISELAAINENQEGSISDLSSQNRELYLIKGELYLSGRQVVRIGRAFLKNPTRKKAYNYSDLKRGSSAKKATKTKAKKKEAKKAEKKVEKKAEEK